MDNIIVTGEAAFSMNGRVNTQNTRHWTTHPPNGNIFEKSIRRDKISVCSGFTGNGTVSGPLFSEGTLNGEKYLLMLNTSFIPAIQLRMAIALNESGLCKMEHLYTEDLSSPTN